MNLAADRVAVRLPFNAARRICHVAVIYFDYSISMETYEPSLQFAALAQATRIEVMRFLGKRGPAGLSAGELANSLGEAPSTLSFHLSALENAGLVQSKRAGRQIIYAIRLAGLRSLLTFIVETGCSGRRDLVRDLLNLLPDSGPSPSIVQPAFNVLFLCTQNSARSIMAEAILETIGNRRFRAFSAGSAPARRPMDEVIERLKQLGHDVSSLRSKSWDEFSGPNAPRMDFVVTLCDTIDGEICPEFGRHVVTAAWPFPDPKKFKGSPAERSTNLNALYGMIRRRLEIFINLPYASLDQIALRKRLDELSDATKYG